MMNGGVSEVMKMTQIRPRRWSFLCSRVNFEKAKDKFIVESVRCRMMKVVRFLELTMFLQILFLEI